MVNIIPPVIPLPGNEVENNGYEVPQIPGYDLSPTPFNPGRPKTGVEYWRNNPRGGGDNTVLPSTKENYARDVEQKSKKTPEEIGLLTLISIGGRELAKLSRHDEINGIRQDYSPIKNMSDIALQYNPLAISPNADNVSTFLTTFNLDITKYVPTQNELDQEYPLDADSDKRQVVFFDKTTNSLTIHVKNIFTNEKIEVEFVFPEEVKDGTIY